MYNNNNIYNKNNILEKPEIILLYLFIFLVLICRNNIGKKKRIIIPQ